MNAYDDAATEQQIELLKQTRNSPQNASIGSRH